LRFGRAQTAVVEAGEEATQVPSAVDRADVGDGGEQLPRLPRVDHQAAIDNVGNCRGAPAESSEVVRRQFFDLDRVLHGVAEHGPLAADRGRRGW
jgi:hypothetical protein